MSTIDQKGPNSNPANETSGEEGRTERSAEESARIREELEASNASAEVDAAMERVGEIIDRPPANAAEESAPAGSSQALEALDGLRTWLEEHGTDAELEGAMSKIEQAIRRSQAERPDESDESAPASATRRAEGVNDEPPTSRTLPPPLSTLAIRLNDGVMLVSLEDAEGRDLSEREIIRCMVLSEEEAAGALKTADEALSGAAARIIARLPKRSTT